MLAKDETRYHAHIFGFKCTKKMRMYRWILPIDFPFEVIFFDRTDGIPKIRHFLFKNEFLDRK